jgi:hypothetical protein
MLARQAAVGQKRTYQLGAGYMGYLRLIRRHSSTQDGQMEQAELEVLLAAIPGVSEVSLHGLHPKGGYNVCCTIDQGSYDSVMSSLVANDWVSVI